MNKNQPQTPLVTSISTTLRKTIQSPTQVVSPEEVKEKKKDLLGVIDQSLNIFKKNLEDGKVDMSTSLDLERLAKLMLLLSGEADSVMDRPQGEQVQDTTTTLQSIGVSMSKVDSILDLSDPTVKAMYDKLYSGYNTANDIDD